MTAVPPKNRTLACTGGLHALGLLNKETFTKLRRLTVYGAQLQYLSGLLNLIGPSTGCVRFYALHTIPGWYDWENYFGAQWDTLRTQAMAQNRLEEVQTTQTIFARFQERLSHASNLDTLVLTFDTADGQLGSSRSLRANIIDPHACSRWIIREAGIQLLDSLNHRCYPRHLTRYGGILDPEALDILSQLPFLVFLHLDIVRDGQEDSERSSPRFWRFPRLQHLSLRLLTGIANASTAIDTIIWPTSLSGVSLSFLTAQTREELQAFLWRYLEPLTKLHELNIYVEAIHGTESPLICDIMAAAYAHSDLRVFCLNIGMDPVMHSSVRLDVAARAWTHIQTVHLNVNQTFFSLLFPVYQARKQEGADDADINFLLKVCPKLETFTCPELTLHISGQSVTFRPTGDWPSPTESVPWEPDQFHPDGRIDFWMDRGQYKRFLNERRLYETIFYLSPRRSLETACSWHPKQLVCSTCGPG